MTFIIDMASGTEYQGDELTCPKHPSRDTTTDRNGPCPQLQLAVVEMTAPAERTDSIIAAIDIDAFFKDI